MSSCRRIRSRCATARATITAPVGVDEQTIAQLARWLDRRLASGPAPAPTVFWTLQGSRIDPSCYVRHLRPRLARKAGITRLISTSVGHREQTL